MPFRRRDESPTNQPLLASRVVTALATGAVVGDAERKKIKFMRFGLVGALATAVVAAGATAGSVILLDRALAESVLKILPPPPLPAPPPAPPSPPPPPPPPPPLERGETRER